jgi:hypothetical protein
VGCCGNKPPVPLYLPLAEQEGTTRVSRWAGYRCNGSRRHRLVTVRRRAPDAKGLTTKNSGKPLFCALLACWPDASSTPPAGDPLQRGEHLSLKGSVLTGPWDYGDDGSLGLWIRGVEGLARETGAGVLQLTRGIDAEEPEGKKHTQTIVPRVRTGTEHGGTRWRGERGRGRG